MKRRRQAVLNGLPVFMARIVPEIGIASFPTFETYVEAFITMKSEQFLLLHCYYFCFLKSKEALLMKKLLSILLTLALCVGLMPVMAVPVSAADISVTVGDGTYESIYVPTYTLYNYSKSQVVVPSSKLVDLNNKTITGITYYPCGDSKIRNIEIRLSEINEESLTAFVDASTAVMVYSGEVNFDVDAGRTDLTFSTPYEYKGGNLLITVIDNTGTWSSGLRFYGVNETGASWSHYRDGEGFSPAYASEGLQRNSLPKMTFYGESASPAPTVYYDLYICGTQVTSENADDLSVISGVSGTVSYNDLTKTLTLKDATIQGDSVNTISVRVPDLTIAFSGTNTISARTSTDYCRGIDAYTYGTLTFAGEENATLKVQTTHNSSPENGAIRGDRVVVIGGTVIAECPEDAYGSPVYMPYALSLNATDTIIKVTGGKLIAKGWVPIAAAITETKIDSGTILYGSTSYDGSNPDLYDYENNDGWATSGWRNTYRYVEATPVPPTPVTVFFEADGGTVSPESIAVMPGETYGELPTPEKDGYIFDGWVLCAGGGARLITIDNNGTPIFRLATDEGDKSWDGNTPSNFKVGSTIVFDVTFNDTVPSALEINDRSVDSSLYTIEGSRIYGRIEMTNAYVNSSHHFMDIVTLAQSSSYTVNKFYVIDPDSSTVITGNSTVAATEGLNGKEGHALLAKWSPAYTVTVTPGAHMTPSGVEEQTVVQGSAITSVTYTADEGYCFPDDYAVNAVNGITVTRDSESQITVSGTPTADAAITLTEASKIPEILKVETPVFDPAATSFEDSIDVTISCVTTGAAIHFTLDGSTPTANSEVTTGAAITLNATTTIKAIAILDGYEDSDVATATYTKNSPSAGGGGGPATYPVKPSSTENGNITVSPRDAAAGMTVTITVTPDEGYELDKLIVKDKDGNEIEVNEKDGEFTFTMPAAAVEISATFRPAGASSPDDGFPFEDVPEDAYCRKAVEWALENGVTGGTSPTTFSPKADATRGQTMTFLWAAAGAPEPKTTENPFKDISESDYYYKAVLWAYENGITAGISADEFGPEVTVTRAQVATFLYGIAGRPDAGDEPFTDVNEGDYFEAAVAWAFKEGITTGTAADKFSPDVDCLREQIITFMYLYFGAE